ncbi:MAG TPA: hypothetical protein VJP79_08030 [Nitrososphaera sp.]|nr:hypothetical protein [Nitrososphaera sp.]
MGKAETHRKRRKELLAGIIGLVAVVLLWRAIWDISAAVMTPITSLIIGLGLLAVLAYFNKEYLRELF